MSGMKKAYNYIPVSCPHDPNNTPDTQQMFVLSKFKLHYFNN